MELRWLDIYRATESASGIYVEVVLGNHPDQRNRCQNGGKCRDCISSRNVRIRHRHALDTMTGEKTGILILAVRKIRISEEKCTKAKMYVSRVIS